MSAVRRRHDWLWAVVAFGFAGAAQFVSHLVLGRVLGAAAYGEAAALGAAMTLLGVPLIGVQIATASLVATGGSPVATLRRYGALGIALGLGLFLLAPWWGALLAVETVPAARAAAAYVPVTMLLSVLRGVAVGQGRTRALASAISAGAFVRVSAATLGAMHFGVLGAVLGPVLGDLAATGVLFFLIRCTGPATPAIDWVRTWGATYSQLTVWVVVNVDLLWARRLLDPVDAGRYLLAGGVAMGLVAVGQAYLWHRASSVTTPASAVEVTVRAMLLVGAAAVPGVPVLAVVLPRLLGPEFTDLTGLLVICAVAAVAASGVMAGVSTLLLAGQRGLRRLVPALALAFTPPVVLGLVGATPEALGVAAGVNATVGCLVLFVPVWFTARKRDRTPLPRTVLPAPNPVVEEYRR
jgi:hypothetical protein